MGRKSSKEDAGPAEPTNLFQFYNYYFRVEQYNYVITATPHCLHYEENGPKKINLENVMFWN